jgi:hypothetical protein
MTHEREFPHLLEGDGLSSRDGVIESLLERLPAHFDRHSEISGIVRVPIDGIRKALGIAYNAGANAALVSMQEFTDLVEPGPDLTKLYVAAHEGSRSGLHS